MILLDTDILTLYMNGHARVMSRVESAPEEPAITIVSRIEILQGRFESVLKAAKSADLLRLQERLLNQNDREDDLDTEVEPLSNNPEFMALMRQLSQDKAAISLQDLRKELGF